MIAAFLPYIIFLYTFIGTNTVFINKIFSIWQQYFNGVIHFTLKTWGYL
jgi:hypothetical protein